jgi:hypothetical protein
MLWVAREIKRMKSIEWIIAGARDQLPANLSNEQKVKNGGTIYECPLTPDQVGQLGNQNISIVYSAKEFKEKGEKAIYYDTEMEFAYANKHMLETYMGASAAQELGRPLTDAPTTLKTTLA